MRNTIVVATVLFAIQGGTLGTGYAQERDRSRIEKELSKQDSVYRSTGNDVPSGYTTDRSLSDYMEMLTADFGRDLTKLGPNDRWLDVGAGQGQAILDYLASSDPSASLKKVRAPQRAHAVALSIEDRRTPIWKALEAELGPARVEYLVNRRLREYTRQELGQFQLITDVLGGFSYAENLSFFLEKVFELLAPNGTFYAVLADVRSEDGANRPYYTGSAFSTSITNVNGSEVSVCAWLKAVACVEVVCEPKQGWKPPIEAYRIRKVCDKVSVPAMTLVDYEAATPPGRGYRLIDTGHAR